MPTFSRFTSPRIPPSTGCGWTSRARFNISRRYPEFPVPGVGAIIIDGGRVLLVERAHEPLKGWWSLPGGVLETGELLRDAVIREVLEETGLAIEPVKVVEIFERIIRDDEGKPEYHYVLVDYLCRVVGGILKASDDAAQAEWFAQADLDKLRITEGTLPVIRKVLSSSDGIDLPSKLGNRAVTGRVSD